MSFAVEFTSQFKRALKAKTPKQQARVEAAVKQLAENPRHNSLRTHRVRGSRGLYEARIDGGNRLTFQWDGSTLVLRTNCDHDKVLNRPH